MCSKSYILAALKDSLANIANNVRDCKGNFIPEKKINHEKVQGFFKKYKLGVALFITDFVQI